MSELKIRFGVWIINIGMKLFPDEYRNKTFINNLILTKKIKTKFVGGCDYLDNED